MSSSNIEPIHEVSGEALDQETIIRLRAKVEDFVSDTITFSRTELFWSMNSDGLFDYVLKFYE